MADLNLHLRDHYRPPPLTMRLLTRLRYGRWGALRFHRVTQQPGALPLESP
jgi:hypothetical protein